MTLPYERKNSVKRTRDFLVRLIDPSVYPDLPEEVRKIANLCLRHFPSDWDMDRAGKGAPDVFGDDERSQQ